MGTAEHMMTKGFILALVAALAIASANFDNVEEFDHETVLTEASASIETMKKKGATEADCKDLAKTTCKEVEAERAEDQKLINALKSGAECVNLGKKGVDRATREWKRSKTQWLSYKKKSDTGAGNESGVLSPG